MTAMGPVVVLAPARPPMTGVVGQRFAHEL